MIVSVSSTNHDPIGLSDCGPALDAKLMFSKIYFQSTFEEILVNDSYLLLAFRSHVIPDIHP
jgi:hypothetical protein